MDAAGLLAAGSVVGAGFYGFLVVVGLVLVSVLLFRSMNHQLRKVQRNFPADPVADPSAPDPAAPPREHP